MIPVSEHAILRYQERVKPGHGFPKAKHELEVLAWMADGVRPGCPDWYHVGNHPEEADGWLELADGIAGVIVRGRLVTVVVRGGAQSDHRAHKNKAKADRRKARRFKNRSSVNRRGSRPREAAWD